MCKIQDTYIMATTMKAVIRSVISEQDPTKPRQLMLACHYDSKKFPVGFLGCIDCSNAHLTKNTF